MSPGTTPAVALKAHRLLALAMVTELVKKDPENAGWQRHLANSQPNLGYVLPASGDPARALDNERAALAHVMARNPTKLSVAKPRRHTLDPPHQRSERA
jgi:hypothetical protein